MNELLFALPTAAWLGILCAISPCPLASNIAAISFVSRGAGRHAAVLNAAVLYALGRALTYALLGMLLVNSMNFAPYLSHMLQKYMNLLLGPVLVIVGMLLLKLLTLPLPASTGVAATLCEKVKKLGVLGSFGLGVIFALSFCPSSAALFFGSVLPLAIKTKAAFLLPVTFGISTGLPVIAFAFVLSFTAGQISRIYDKAALFNSWAQRATGIIFLLIGIVMTITMTLGIKNW
jgi:cytochrome c-type biogenesis protein